MTIAGWIGFALIAGIFIGFGAWLTYFLRDNSVTPSKVHFLPLIICTVLTLAILGGMLFYYNRTESGRRAIHTQESELTGGLNRTVRVYDVEGELIAEYSGQFDIEYDNERIIFDDENGLRHIIYFSVSTVIIDEDGE